MIEPLSRGGGRSRMQWRGASGYQSAPILGRSGGDCQVCHHFDLIAAPGMHDPT